MANELEREFSVQDWAVRSAEMEIDEEPRGLLIGAMIHRKVREAEIAQKVGQGYSEDELRAAFDRAYVDVGIDRAGQYANGTRW